MINAWIFLGSRSYLKTGLFFFLFFLFFFFFFFFFWGGGVSLGSGIGLLTFQIFLGF